MPSQQLLDEFFKVLESATSFKTLAPTEQAELKNSYLQVSDEQLKNGMLIIQRIEKKLAEDIKKNDEEAAKIAGELKVKLAQVQKEELVENEKKEKIASGVLLKDLEKEIDAL